MKVSASYILASLLICCVFYSPVRALHKCDSRLLKTFHLSGLKTSILDRMHICPNVHEKCCSLMDEVRIVEYWNNKALPKVKAFRDNVITLYQILLEFHEDLAKTNFDDIVFHYVFYKKVPYIHKTCMDNTARPELTTRMVEKEASSMIPGNGNVEKTKQIPIFYNLTDDDIENYRTYVKNVIIKYVDFLQQIRKDYSHFRKYCNHRYRFFGRRKKRCRRKRYRHLFQIKGAQKAQTLLSYANKKKFVENVLNKYVQLQYKNYKALKSSNNKDPRQLKDIKEEFGSMAVKYLKNMSAKQQKRFYVRLVKNIKSSKERKLFFKKIGRGIKKGAKAVGKGIKKAGKAIGKGIKKGFNIITGKYRRKEKKRKKKEKAAWKKYKQSIRQTKKVLKEDRPLQLTTKFKPRERNPYIPHKIEKPFASCINENRTFVRPYLVSNNAKLRYCEDTIDIIKKFDIQGFRAVLTTISDRLYSILVLKKTLYCSICDAHEQKYFNAENRMVVLSQEYCHSLLSNYRDYIWWKNVLLVEYLENIFQLMSCAGGPGNRYKFPSPSLLSWHKRRIYFIKRCYKNLDGRNFYRYCRFICMQYKMNKYSKFFEADADLLKRIYSKIVAFMRKSYGKTEYTLSAMRRAKLRLKTIRVEKLLNKIKIKKKRRRGKLASKGRRKKGGKYNAQRKKFASRSSNIKNKASKARRRYRSRKIKRRSRVSLRKKRTGRKRYRRNRRARKRRRRIRGRKRRIRRKMKKHIVTSFYLKKQIEKMKFFMEKRLRMKDLKEPRRPFAYRETYISHQIYEKVDRPYDIRCWRSFYSRHKNALNPLRDISMVNFDFNIVNLLSKQMQRSKKEKLAFGVLDSVLKADSETEHNFNHEFDDSFAKLKPKVNKDNEDYKMVVKDGKAKPVNDTSVDMDWIEPYVAPNSRDQESKLVHNLMHVNHKHI